MGDELKAGLQLSSSWEAVTHAGLILLLLLVMQPVSKSINSLTHQLGLETVSLVCCEVPL